MGLTSSRGIGIGISIGSPPRLFQSSPLLRQRFLSIHHCHQSNRNVTTPTTTFEPLDLLRDASLQTFRERCFQPELPAVLHSPALRTLPARRSWFVPAQQQTFSSQCHLNYDYFEKYADVQVPLELTASPTRNDGDSDGSNEQFQRFEAPLGIFLDWIRSSTTPATAQPFRLYLAQCQLNNLPSQLQQDIPTPAIVLEAGRGDIYDTNIWIGLPPTYTPLHRDPNPNLFVQLEGTKHVRLLPPADGLKLFSRVRAALGRDAGRGAVVFRGEEMMKGREKELLEDAVWGDGGGGGCDGYEAVLKGGDALFIPKGWWHSIKGVGEGITASVNWWFR